MTDAQGQRELTSDFEDSIRQLECVRARHRRSVGSAVLDRQRRAAIRAVAAINTGAAAWYAMNAFDEEVARDGTAVSADSIVQIIDEGAEQQNDDEQSFSVRRDENFRRFTRLVNLMASMKH